MKRITLLSIVLCILTCTVLLLAGCGGGMGSGAPGTSPGTGYDDSSLDPHVKGEVVVRLKSGTAPAEAASLVGGTTGQEFSIGQARYVKVLLPAGMTVSEAIEKLNGSGKVVFAEPDYTYATSLIPNDPDFSPRQYCHENMQTTEAWDVTTGDPGIVIAIVDTGVDGAHPEFAGRVPASYDFVNDEPLAAGANSDENGHGTHVAGIAAATGNNDEGVAGMNWSCQILPVRALNAAGSGSNASVAQAITYAVDNDADVINMSIGGKGNSSTIRDAIIYARVAGRENKGCVLVAAMGNSGIRSVEFPAAYSGIIAVGSTDARDLLSYFSTIGPWISVTAPGSEVFSTYLTAEGDYATMSGTSMATPQVAGLCSLLLSQNPDLTAEEVRSIIEQSADDLGDAGFDERFGHGRINANSALTGISDNTYGGIMVTVINNVGPLSGVDVVLWNADHSAVVTTARSDDDGHVYFFDIPAGTYQADAFFVNETVGTGNVAVIPGAITNAIIDFED